MMSLPNWSDRRKETAEHNWVGGPGEQQLQFEDSDVGEIGWIRDRREKGQCLSERLGRQEDYGQGLGGPNGLGGCGMISSKPKVIAMGCRTRVV